MYVLLSLYVFHYMYQGFQYVLSRRQKTEKQAANGSSIFTLLLLSAKVGANLGQFA